MPDSSGDMDRMHRDLRSAASALRGAGSVLVVSHIDADGITAGSIAMLTLERLGIEHRISFEKKITKETVEMVNSATEDFVWICDLGSGYLSEFDRDNLIVTDHHVPDPRFRRNQTSLDNFMRVHHLNPHLYGYDGSYEVSGAGMTYLLSKAVDPYNADLAYLAVIGAVGDFQDSGAGALVSLNRMNLQDAVDNGRIVIDEDLRLFGRDTRPVTQFLQFCSEPVIPGITDNPDGCLDLLEGLGIELKRNGRLRVWNDLSPEERGSVRQALLKRMDADGRRRLVGEMYTVTGMTPRTGLGDAKEFATILNSCGRYDDAVTGMRICFGEKDALSVAEKNRADHRRNISTALGYIKENHLIRKRRFIQFFDSGDTIPETVVGIVAGMMLNCGECDPNMPILAFAKADDGTKVSARANRNLVEHGLNLSEIMKTASESVGGFGGGHSVAAGATIPDDRKEEFLQIVEDLVAAQVI